MIVTAGQSKAARKKAKGQGNGGKGNSDEERPITAGARNRLRGGAPKKKKT